MSKQTVIISTQYFENYNVCLEGFNIQGDKLPHWKPKGEHLFKMEVDADILMYSDPAKVFEKMLESQNSIAEEFHYRGYDIQWSVPTVLGTQEDYIAANDSIEEETDHVIAGVDFSDSINQLNSL